MIRDQRKDLLEQPANERISACPDRRLRTRLPSAGRAGRVPVPAAESWRVRVRQEQDDRGRLLPGGPATGLHRYRSDDHGHVLQFGCNAGRSRGGLQGRRHILCVRAEPAYRRCRGLRDGQPHRPAWPREGLRHSGRHDRRLLRQFLGRAHHGGSAGLSVRRAVCGDPDAGRRALGAADVPQCLDFPAAGLRGGRVRDRGLGAFVGDDDIHPSGRDAQRGFGRRGPGLVAVDRHAGGRLCRDLRAGGRTRLFRRAG